MQPSVPITDSQSEKNETDVSVGSCKISMAMPSGDRKFTYSVMISPGEKNLSAIFVGTNLDHAANKLASEARGRGIGIVTSCLGNGDADVYVVNPEHSPSNAANRPRELDAGHYDNLDLGQINVASVYEDISKPAQERETSPQHVDGKQITGIETAEQPRT
ncbi:hypothetical protein BaRGS_00011017 [Batillaria attramentaria]|uniref:Uncharacterized protein n=1 Tax=Batillaria attramentaria TaxID=370345 RepID=A0ABD0LEZ7_9CAEN